MGEIPGFTAESGLELSKDLANFRYSGAPILLSVPPYELFGPGSIPPEWWPFLDKYGRIIWKLLEYAEKPFEPHYPIPPTTLEKIAEAVPHVVFAFIVGILLGYVGGMGWQWLITPKTNYGKVPTSGCSVIGPNPERLIIRSYWGCERSMALTINEAEQTCATSTTCVGMCKGGGPCTGTAIIDRAISTPGFFSCETQIFYKCACGC